jgi:hypothetical protein
MRRVERLHHPQGLRIGRRRNACRSEQSDDACENVAHRFSSLVVLSA